MSNFKQYFFLSLLLYYGTGLLAQTHLTGNVYSAMDSTALPGASVYFDGTSTGVSTTDKGYFQISLEDQTTSPLVVSSLGYETIYIPGNLQRTGQKLKIYLKESEESLGEVHLETDPWSRRKKLNVFRREFLGSSPAAYSCKIKNEEVLQLTYIPSKDILIASAAEPLIIINKHLGYEVRYDLRNFEAEFSTGLSNFRFTQKVFYEGTSFFKELRKNTPRRYLRNRKKAFRGSTLQFMRSLTEKKLKENNFRIFKKSYEVPPYTPFVFSKDNGLTKVELKEESINILYRELDQSSMHASGIFFIDNLGNHAPPQNVTFSGSMGYQRFAETLPLNYSVLEK
jgi:hypothetical protein